MRDEIVETIMNLCDLYLKLGDINRTGGILHAKNADSIIDCVCDAVIFREEIWNRLLASLQKIHRL